MPLIRCLLAILAVAALQPWWSLNAQPKWRELRPPGAGFQIQFPGEPKTELKNLPSKVGDVPVLLSILSDDSGKDFLTMYTNFPSGTFSSDSQRELDTLRDDNLRAVGGRILSQVPLVLNGSPARRLVIEFQDEKRVATMLIAIKGQQLYQVICVTPATEENTTTVQRFISSFALLASN